MWFAIKISLGPIATYMYIALHVCVPDLAVCASQKRTIHTSNVIMLG